MFDLGHFDFAAVSRHAETSLTHGGDRADAAGNLREGPHRVLARVEELQLLVVPERPRPGSGVATPDQVIDQVDMSMPVDLRFGRTAPAFIAGAGIVLRRRRCVARRNEIRGFHERGDSHGKQPVEIDGT